MNVEPLQDYIVLKEIKKESKLIIIHDSADLEPTHQAEVISVGPNSKLGVKKGDKVLIKEYGFDKLKLDKDEILIGREENIYAIVK